MTWSNSWQGSKGWGNLNSIEGTLLCCFEVGARKEEKFIETNDKNISFGQENCHEFDIKSNFLALKNMKNLKRLCLFIFTTLNWS